jgi:UDP-N-acetylmuramate: L-alanyl-gamma-D-glutamyl-meso-diaminopimelate ligase
MRLHILGICGTFMAGVATLARDLGHTVSGSDANAYPPMSDVLAAAGIRVEGGYDPAHLDHRPDVVVVGNALSRGNPAVERVLDDAMPYTSGPEWLARQVLAGRPVMAVAGTHGKTTTSSMLARILDEAGLECGFLIGGVPLDFGVSARLGRPDGWFVIEADEYDTAFFDKRSKFVHYHPRTLVITSIEYDHADIFPDLVAIEREFHHLVRTVPGAGRIVRRLPEPSIDTVLASGCWTPVTGYGASGSQAPWQARLDGADGSAFTVLLDGEPAGSVHWAQIGEHNVHNALAAIAAAHESGAVEARRACEALAGFRGVRRRLEVRGCARGVTVYDDFAHHPTAVRASLAALRARVGPGTRILALLDPASNTMRLGVHRETLGPSLAEADLAWVRRPADAAWNLEEIARGPSLRLAEDEARIIEAVIEEAREGDHVLIMSNGAFGGIHQRLLGALEAPA